MSSMDVSLRLRLVNQLGAGAAGAARDLNRVENAAKRIGTARFGDAVTRQLRQMGAAAIENIRSFERLATVAAGATAGFAAMKKVLGAPAEAAAEFEDEFIDVLQKTDIAKDKIGAFRDALIDMAATLKTSPLAVAQGINVLMGSGLDLDPSKKLIEPITKVAKAYRVSTTDVSKSVFSMVNNLKVAPEQMEVALARLSQAAADGRYEMSDFARGMPNMASIFQANNQLGLKGVSRIAAAVETVAGVVGTPGEADAALRDFIQKATSDEVLKALRKAGVKDLEKNLAKARKTGDDPVPVISKALQRGIKGDPGLIPKFFGDIQGQTAARAFATKEGLDAYLKLVEKYDRILSPDKLNADLALRQEGAGDKFRTFSDRFQAFLTSVGTGVNAYLGPFVSKMGELLDYVTRLTEAFPKLTGAVTIFGAAVAGGVAFKAITGILSKMGGAAGTGAGVGAGSAAAGGAAAGAAAGGAIAQGGLRALLGRLGTVGLAYLVGQTTWDGLSALGEAFRIRPWTAQGREEGAARLKDLQERRSELEGRIAQIYARSKVPEMADTLAAPLKIQLQDVQNQIRVLEDSLRGLDMLRPAPKIDTSSIDEALGKVRALHAALSSSFAANAAPAGSSAAPRGGQGGVSQSNTINVSGYDPGTVARRVVREQNRQIARARAGALHDLGAWA